MDARALKHSTHRATSDNTGTGASGLEQYDAGRLLALGDRCWYLLGLAITDANHAVTVAHHDKRGEAEAPAALDDFGDAVDGHYPLEVGGLLVGAAAAAIIAAISPLAAGAAPRSCCHY